MDKEDRIECSTDLKTCCSSMQGLYRGDWYFPNGTRVPLVGDVYETRAQQRVTLYRDVNGSSPSGIYHCSIPVNDMIIGSDIIGLYEFGGEISSYLHISGCGLCVSHTRVRVDHNAYPTWEYIGNAILFDNLPTLIYIDYRQ